MRFHLPTLLGAVVLGLLPAALPAAAPEGVTSFTLPNGLIGVVIEDHRAPVVTQMVWYKVGSADEPPGQSGIAHFLEHLMFKATDTLADGEFSQVVAENGGDENAFTTHDYTAYFQRIAADRLDLVMGMEADRMVNLAPGPAAVPSERDVVIEERRQRVGNSPDGPFHEQMRAALYVNQPVPASGDRLAGTRSAAYDRERALAFYRTHYAPNNAILVVAGDVDPAEVERLAAAHFGPIPAARRAAARPAAGAGAGGGAADRDAATRGCREPYVSAALPGAAAQGRRPARGGGADGAGGAPRRLGDHLR